jgi:phage FluMu protein Com
MLSVVEIKCPHCGAVGQVIVPPMGQITIGPCPRCQELVVLFEGRVFPLDKEKMIYGTYQEKRKHLLSILTKFLKEQVQELIPADGELPDVETARRRPTRSHKKYKPTIRNQKAGRITKQELEDFLRIDIPLLSKEDYFKQVFGELSDKDDQES